jgi:hypothetical protein
MVGDQEQGASTSLLHHIIAQLFPFSKPLHCLNKQNGLRFGAEVKWLPTMRNEMLESWPTSTRPHLYAINHERTREIVKHAHKKSLLLLQKARNNGREIVVADVTD